MPRKFKVACQRNYDLTAERNFLKSTDSAVCRKSSGCISACIINVAQHLSLCASVLASVSAMSASGGVTAKQINYRCVHVADWGEID